MAIRLVNACNVQPVLRVRVCTATRLWLRATSYEPASRQTTSLTSSSSHQPYTPLSLSLPCPCSGSIAPASLPLTEPELPCELSRESGASLSQTICIHRRQSARLLGSSLVQRPMSCSPPCLLRSACLWLQNPNPIYLCKSIFHTASMRTATAISPLYPAHGNFGRVQTLKPRAVCALD